MATSTLITDYVGKGIASARPSSVTISSGALGLYYATDTGVVSAWDGSAWATVATSGLFSGTNTWTGSQRLTPVALTDATTIAVNFALGNNFSVTLAGNRTLGNPTNHVAGQGGQIVITQDGTGSRTLAYGSNWKFPGGTAPVLSTAAGAIDILSYYTWSTTRVAVVSLLNLS